ncbi:MAG: hypothetical protein JST00_12200 [Deltaproteobacteria bacterium]|nr:hypothetical protein [Deltaproteobacteria bacterium]
MCRRLLTTIAFLTLGLAAACEERQAQFPIARPAAPGTCIDWAGQPVDRTCIPRMARANAPLALEIEERCGACGSTAETCTVTVDGKSVVLSLDGKACEPKEGTQCTESCSKRRIRCQVPPLSAGKYNVRYGDAAGEVETVTVVDQPDATTTCILDDAAKGG